MVDGVAFELAVEGTGFVSGTAVLWNGGALATTFVDSEHLSATVDAGKLSNPAAVTINTRAPGPRQLRLKKPAVCSGYARAGHYQTHPQDRGGRRTDDNDHG